MMRRMLVGSLWAAATVLGLTLVACSDSGGGPTAAQDPGFEDVSAGEIATAAGLADLTDADRAAVRQILMQAHLEILQVLRRFRAGEIDRQAAHDEVQAIHDRAIDQLAQYLTDAQIDRLQGSIRDHRPHDRPDLGLTDDQIADLRAIQHAFHDFVQELHRKVQAGQVRPEDARMQLREAARRARAAACDVLTGEQRAMVPFCSGDAPPG